MCERIAEVVDVVKGKNPYAVTETAEIDGTVTFSLQKSHCVWVEDRLPLRGETVVLSNLAHMEEKGWRAMNARPYHPDDERN